jgi:thermostable 8-oxoguanine DNA glycosylase
MIDPTKPTNYTRTKSELEEWLLFCVVVAGKSSFQQSRKLDNFLKLEDYGTPFQKIFQMFCKSTLLHNLKKVKMGQYNRIEHVFSVLCHYEICDITLEVLEGIKGIGPKTSRFYFLHSFPNQEIAVLDTHILSWLRDLGYDAPNSTPNLKKYLELEKIFLFEAKNRGKSPADLDIEIWNNRVRIISPN